MSGRLHPEAMARVGRYLEIADLSLPSRVEGLYLVGSCALGDYQPGRSDVDFVAVIASPFSAAELDAAEAAHRGLDGESRRPWFSGVYVTWEGLASDPRASGFVASHHEGRFSRDGGFDANPVQWLTLRDHPLAARGPERPAVWVDDQAVRAWTLENLNSYWARWIERRRRWLGSGIAMLADWSISWGVLGILRLHYTLATGRVISKSAAAEYGRATFDPVEHRVIEEALRLRRGGGPALYGLDRIARRREALRLMSRVLHAANQPRLRSG